MAWLCFVFDFGVLTMSTVTKTRFKTGEESPRHARYRFDGYLDGTTSPRPTAEEMEIDLELKENFPPIRSANKGCWWQFVRQL